MLSHNHYLEEERFLANLITHTEPDENDEVEDCLDDGDDSFDNQEDEYEI